MNQPQQPQGPNQQQGNPYITPEMWQYKKELGIPDFSPQLIADNPQMLQQYQAGNDQQKYYIESQWMTFQIQYYMNEKNNGRYYPALGDRQAWEAKQKGGAGQAKANKKQIPQENPDFDEGRKINQF